MNPLFDEPPTVSKRDKCLKETLSRTREATGFLSVALNEMRFIIIIEWHTTERRKINENEAFIRRRKEQYEREV